MPTERIVGEYIDLPLLFEKILEIFVNECSFHEQFHDISSFTLAFRMFFSVLNELNKRQLDQRLYKDSNLFYVYKVVKNELFISSLNSLPDKSLGWALINTLDNKLNARDWRAEQAHSSDDWFTCEGDIVTETSMAELAERLLVQPTLLGLLINFPQSKFAGLPTVIVVKNEKIPSELDCADETRMLKVWLEDNLHISRYEYDYSSTDPPSDLQTVLRNRTRFGGTSFIQQGRKVYKESGTNRHWYVDNRHSGNSAHLEVFDSRGKHIGESDLDGNNLDRDKRDPTRTIDI